jgi:hypothetical protein
MAMQLGLYARKQICPYFYIHPTIRSAGFNPPSGEVVAGNEGKRMGTYVLRPKNSS